MKRYKKVFAMAVVSSLLLLGSASVEVQAASKPKLNYSKISLYKGSSKQLKVKNTKKKVKFSTSNKKVAKVSKKGKVTAVKKGTCKVYAKVKGKKLTCNVTVKEKTVKKPTKGSKSTEKKTTEKTTVNKTTEKTTTEKTIERETTEVPTTEKTPAQICAEQGHDWIGGHKDHTMGSCYTSGKEGKNECLRCGKVETFVYDTIEHTWAGGVHKDHTMSNCKLSGTTGMNFCIVCGISDRFVYDIVPHEMVTETLPATCEKNGSVKTYCKNCGEVESSNVLPATRHKWVFDVNIEWDCCHKGHIKKHCEYCDVVEEYDTREPANIHHTGPYEQKYEYLDLNNGLGLKMYWCEYCTGCGKRIGCCLFDTY